MSDIAVIGCGHVGLVTAACFASLGHNVDCVDIDTSRVRALRSGEVPFHEPGLPELVREGLAQGRLTFRDSYPQRLQATTAFIATNTPASQDGAADVRAVRDAVAALARTLPRGAVIVNKSTVPIGTGDIVSGIAERCGRGDLRVVSNPEFLREGSAVADFLRPDRVVLGSDDAVAMEQVAGLYAPLAAPILRLDIRTAEMVKYASNAFLATKISFINEMAAICEAVGADVAEVARGMGFDERIGTQFLNAGLGWGGSCFPKDVQALAHTAAVHGAHPQLLRSVMDINRDQRLRVVQKLTEVLGGLEGRRIGILGAAFKPHTDDLRYSPAIELAALLSIEGAQVAVYDPVVSAEAIERSGCGAKASANVESAAIGAQALVLATEWPEFRDLPFARLAQLMAYPVLVDARNFLDGAVLRGAGFVYRSIGRPASDGGPLTAERDVRPSELAATVAAR